MLARYHVKICKVKKNKGHAVSELMWIRSVLEFPGSPVVRALLLHFHFSLSCIGEGNGNPPHYSYLENPMDRGAWRATDHSVTKSQTQLK